MTHSFIYAIGIIFTRSIGIILIPIYTRYLPLAEYGIVDLFMILASIISLTIALEIHQAVVRFYQDADDENEKIQYPYLPTLKGIEEKAKLTLDFIRIKTQNSRIR